MGLFERKKKNGDYFVDIIRSVTKTEANVTNLVGKVDEHVKGDYERRKVDRQWQTGVDETLLEAVKCAEKATINGIAKDVQTLKSDKKGLRMVWKFVIGAIIIIAGILGIIWKGGKIFGEVYCQNVCCSQLIEAIGSQKDKDIVLHSRTCKQLDTLDPDDAILIFDKPLYMAEESLVLNITECTICKLVAQESFPCNAYCCCHFSYIADMGINPPALHRLSCPMLNAISGYHLFFIVWNAKFGILEKRSDLCKICFKDYHNQQKGKLM